MKTHTFLMILFALLVGVSGGASAKKVAANGITTLNSSVAGTRVRVDIKTRQVNIGRPSDSRPEMIENNCTYSRYPCSLVQRIDISVGAERIFVPRSSFGALSDLDKASILAKDGLMTLILVGGDASESYTVKLLFNGEHVYRRLLYPSGSGRPAEDTKYNLID